MKKVFLALAVVAMFSFVACNAPDPNRPVENAVVEHFSQNEEVYDVEAYVADTLRAYGVKFTKVNAMVSLDGEEYVKTVRYVMSGTHEVVSSIDTAIARCYADSVRRAELRARIDVM